MQGVNLCAAPVQAVARLTYTRLWTRQARYGDDRVSGPVAAGEWSCSDCLLMINFASCDKNKTAGFLCMWPVFQAPFYFPVVKVVVYHVRSGQCVRSRVKRGLCRWRQNKTSNKTIRVFFLFFFLGGCLFKVPQWPQGVKSSHSNFGRHLPVRTTRNRRLTLIAFPVGLWKRDVPKS